MKKIIYLIIFCLIVGCNREQNEINLSKSDKIVLTFWHGMMSSSIPALNKLIEEFEKSHPNIKIKAQTIPNGDAGIQKIMTALQSNTAPDISWIYADYLEDLVKANAIYPMKEFIESENGLTKEEIEDIYPALRIYASWKGTLYSIPMEATNLAMIYNKTLFREAGINPDKPPNNWDELYEYAKKILKDFNNDGIFERIGFFIPVFPSTGSRNGWMVWQFRPFIWQAGGEIIEEDQSKVIFDSEAGIRALTLWKNLYKEQNLSRITSDFDMLFVSGQLGMAMDGPWSLPRYKELLKNIDWAFAPLPAGPVKRATIVGGEYLAIFKQSRHPKEAWEFVKWIIKPETQAMWSMASGYLPVRKATNKLPEFKKYLEENPNFKVFVDQMEYAQAERSIDYGGMQITRYLGEAIESVTIGDIEPAYALKIAAEKSNNLLKSYKKFR
ncbi:ABC transporter substrate-binding protein [Rosettibacter primus]|uniref:ABC transporter substrate-binding protein n=1 Tax=Rosettibacter primus TaxID=3111523 RepID=UPI00336C1226